MHVLIHAFNEQLLQASTYMQGTLVQLEVDIINNIHISNASYSLHSSVARTKASEFYWSKEWERRMD